MAEEDLRSGDDGAKDESRADWRKRTLSDEETTEEIILKVLSRLWFQNVYINKLDQKS